MWWPRAATSRTRSGCAFAFSPMRKKEARIPYWSSSARTAGVYLGSGPSSTVMATTFRPASSSYTGRLSAAVTTRGKGSAADAGGLLGAGVAVAGAGVPVAGAGVPVAGEGVAGAGVASAALFGAGAGVGDSVGAGATDSAASGATSGATSGPPAAACSPRGGPRKSPWHPPTPRSESPAPSMSILRETI